jgi:hypothetical protein
MYSLCGHDPVWRVVHNFELQFEIEFHGGGGGLATSRSSGLDDAAGSGRVATSLGRHSSGSRESSVWRRTPSMRRTPSQVVKVSEQPQAHTQTHTRPGNRFDLHQPNSARTAAMMNLTSTSGQPCLDRYMLTHDPAGQFGIRCARPRPISLHV